MLGKKEVSWEDRRSHRRADIRGHLPVFDHVTGKRYGSLVNISESGLLMVSDESIPVNRIFQLTVLLPEPIDGASMIHCGAESLWITPADDAHSHWVGFYIIDVSEADLARIRTLIEQL